MPSTLLLTSDFPPLEGSIARTLGEVARHYPPGALIVSTGDAEGAIEQDAGLGVAIDRLPLPARRLRSLPGVLLWSRRVAALARAVDPEFVWCGNLRPAAYPAKWVRERLGIPYGILLHGPDLLSLQHRLHQSRVKRRTIRSLIGSASVIVANSRWTRERFDVLLGELGLDPAPDRVRVVPLGTRPDVFRPGIPAQAVKRRYKLESGRWILTVARLLPSQGVDVALRAVAALGPEADDVGYAVVGHGEQQAELERMARELGLTERVRFLTDVPAEDLPAVYNAATLYVGVSREAGLDVEGFGLALLEASASGIPVVAGRSGGLPDAVRDGETGILVDSESPQAVAQALGALLADPDRAAALGRGGRFAVETYYNWDRVVEELQTISSAFRLERPRTVPA